VVFFIPWRIPWNVVCCETALRLELGGEFNRSVQQLLVLLDEEVAHDDVTDMVYGGAEGRTVGALEERAKCVGHLSGAGKEELDWYPADCGSPWRDRDGATPQSCGGVEA
jgi:hypothetical protein